MGSWLKFLRNRWIGAVLALGLVVVFYAARTGGAALGAAVGAAVAAAFSALGTFLLWRVIKGQTVIFREQTEAMRPGCRVHLWGAKVAGTQDSFLGYFGTARIGDPKQFTGLVCIVVPKPGCRAVPVTAYMDFLDSNEAVLDSVEAQIVHVSNHERFRPKSLLTLESSAEEVIAALPKMHFAGVWLPSKVLEEEGEAVYVGLASDLFAYYVQTLGPKRASRIRIAVKSNYGMDLSESIPLPALDDLHPLVLRPDLWLKEQADDRQPSETQPPDQ